MQDSKGKKKPSPLYLMSIALILIFIIYIALYISYPNKPPPEPEIRSRCYTISVPLSRWAKDHDCNYFGDIDFLLDDGYITALPLNVLSGNGRNSVEMRNIPFGSDAFAGNFTYIPIIEGDEIPGYYLIGYGLEKTEGLDVNGDEIGDHVIIVINSIDMEKEFYSLPRESKIEQCDPEFSLPPLSELLE